MNTSVNIGGLRLKNPVMTASGTFGYGREMESLVDLSRLGGILPKTITPEPRIGNRPSRTIETAAGMLNAIELGSFEYIEAQELRVSAVRNNSDFFIVFFIKLISSKFNKALTGRSSLQCSRIQRQDVNL